MINAARISTNLDKYKTYNAGRILFFMSYVSFHVDTSRRFVLGEANVG